jgi:hypothetical protein
MKNLKQNWQSHISTIAGALVALGTAWSTIDMSTFDLSKDYPKLILPGMIALGGYMTKLNVPNNGSSNTGQN